MKKINPPSRTKKSFFLVDGLSLAKGARPRREPPLRGAFTPSIRTHFLSMIRNNLAFRDWSDRPMVPAPASQAG